MPLEEYKRKRRFEETPEPPPKIEKKSRHRFVVQKHRATRLHYDFRLEMEGVLKSWAVPKGPSLDPSDKRLAMQVEDHPVSYFDFEGTIPEGNYGAGSVMVWDVGTWEPLSPEPVNGKFVPGSDAEATAMLKKGDFKIRLHGKRLEGDFALIHMHSRRPGTKGTEWLLIKKQDDAVVRGYDIEKDDTSVLTGRSMAQIAGDEDSAEWKSSRPASRGKVKAAWLADTIAKLDKQKTDQQKKDKQKKKVSKQRPNGEDREAAKNEDVKAAQPRSASSSGRKPASPLPSVLKDISGAMASSAPPVIHPMLATPVDEPFDHADWLYEIKWDGYRAIALIDNRNVSLMSRTQNDLTPRYPELHDLYRFVKAKTAILDGEVVALDENGRASFSLMQQRTGIRANGRHGPAQPGIPVLYYVFDLLYLDGYDLRRVQLEQRKQVLSQILREQGRVRYSEHFDQGVALFEAAKKKELEGILAKCRTSLYEERRSRQWLKIKVTQTAECVIGGYTDPEGSREYFGAIVLGLYDKERRLIHVGQAGTGFDHARLRELSQLFKPQETKHSPFYGPVDARHVHWLEPKLVAEIKFTEWTHETAEGGLKLRAPVFIGLRDDKKPGECTFEEQVEVQSSGKK
jgi:bifunctional non-homologous end joining protein LigD